MEENADVQIFNQGKSIETDEVRKCLRKQYRR